jgi:hypothetical protein
MTNPATPQRLALEKRLADLERRMAALERTPILTSASVTGLLRVKDASGNVVGAFGNLGSTTDPEHGLTVDGATDFLLAVTDERGVMRPWMPHSWYDPSIVRTVTTTGPWFVLWSSIVPLTTALDFKFQVPIVVPAGTTAEVRLATSAGTLPYLLTPTADGAVHLYELNGAHGSPLLVGPAQFNLEVRRSAGAGTVSVYEPYTLAIGHNGDTPGWSTLS